MEVKTVNPVLESGPEFEKFFQDVEKKFQDYESRIKYLEEQLQGKRKYEEQWDDLRVPASSVKVLGSLNLPTWGSWLGTLQLLWFDKGDQVFFITQMPHAWKEGSRIEPHVHWTPEADWTGTDTCIWNLEYTIANIGGTFPTPVTISGEKHLGYPANFVINTHLITPLPFIEMKNKTISSVIVGRLERDGADDFDHLAGFLEIDFHYISDSNGSNSEFVKDDFIGPDEGVGKDLWS